MTPQPAKGHSSSDVSSVLHVTLDIQICPMPGVGVVSVEVCLYVVDEYAITHASRSTHVM